MRNLLRFIVRNYFVLLFLLLEGVSFLLIFQYNTFQKSKFVNVSRTLAGNIFETSQGFREFISLRNSNEILKLENARLRNELQQKKEYTFYRDTFNKTVDTIVNQQRMNYFYIPAKVINNSTNKQYNYITINKGWLQGVKSDMAVVSVQGVVGVVIESSDNFSTIIPVLNKNFRLSAKIKRNNQFGVLEWDGRNPRKARLNEIPAHIDIQQGDTIVTSGFSAIFPEGIIVGIVDEFGVKEGNFYDIEINLSTNFGKLFHVNVISNFYREEQINLEDQLAND
jgi:rod shape-determining protein MreC